MLKKSYKGQTLIELAVTIMVATITLVGLVSLSISGLKNAQEAQRKTTATKLANLGIEVVTFCRNAYYNSLADSCLFQTTGNVNVTYNSGGVLTTTGVPVDGFVSITTIDGLTYKRKINIQFNSADTYLVTSEVKWDVSNTQVGSVKYSRILTTWK